MAIDINLNITITSPILAQLIKDNAPPNKFSAVESIKIDDVKEESKKTAKAAKKEAAKEPAGPTIEECRAKLRELGAAGMSTDDCAALIKTLGVNALKDLPESKHQAWLETAAKKLEELKLG